MLIPKPETTERPQVGLEKGTVYLARQVPALPVPAPRPHAA